MEELGIVLDPELDEKTKSEIKSVLEKYKDVFAMSNDDIAIPSKLRPAKLTVRPEMTGKIKNKSYPTSPKYRNILQDEIEKLEAANLVEESNDPNIVISPMVLIRKPGGRGFRTVLDLRQVNEVTEDINTCLGPAPIEEILQRLAEGADSEKLFSTADLFSGFFQQELEEDSRSLCGFLDTNYKVKRLTRLPQGYKSSNVIFNKAMVEALQHLYFKNALIYVDDVVVYSSKITHAKVLEDLLKTLREWNLKLKGSKSKFGYRKISLLGICFTHEGIKPDEKRIKILDEIKTPKSLNDLQKILGFYNYNKRFIKNYSQTTYCLRELLKKDQPFIWKKEHSDALEKLKEQLKESIMLYHPDVNKEFYLETDSSHKGLGYQIYQKDEKTNVKRLCLMGGRATRKSEQSYGITQLEMLCIVYALDQNKRLLMNGKQIEIFTDHVSLRAFSQLKNATGKLQRYAIFLSEFPIKVTYKPGRSLIGPDFLSRVFTEKEPENDDEDDITQEAVVGVITCEKAVKARQVKIRYGDQRVKDKETQTVKIEQGQRQHYFSDARASFSEMQKIAESNKEQTAQKAEEVKKQFKAAVQATLLPAAKIASERVEVEVDQQHFLDSEKCWN